jgi:hypothetical protein
LLKGPSFFNPDRHPDRAKERLAYVLGRMKEDGVISAEDNDRALAARGRDPKARRRRGGARGALPACQQALQTLRLPLSDVHWEPAVILDKGGGKRGDGNIRVGIRDGRVLPLNAASLNERKPRQAQRPKFPRTFQGRIRWQDQRHAISARVA